MIWTVVRVGLLRMWHGRTEILLTFVVPVAFFTIFAFIFDEQIGLGKSPKVGVALVDEDRSELSRALIAALAEQETLRVFGPEEAGPGALLVFESEEPARRVVVEGGVPLAVVVPEGWGASIEDPGTDPLGIRILADTSDPVAIRMVTAHIQNLAGRALADAARRQIEAALSLSGSPMAAEAASRFTRPVEVEVEDLFSAGKANPVVSMYAAGIAVMFLLFGAVGNAGSLLEEEENQTLERLLCSQLGMTRLLAGKWLLMWIVGVVQVTVMFAWAQLAFGVDLLGHLSGFAVMTAVTAAAASSFALALATACRSRTQLNAVAVILILSMSALGGSMVPRYVMSETMREVGRLTFNAWALDGYTKVLWRGLPVEALWPEVTVLLAVALALLAVARRLARRWESA
jgi:ABC-2 type transport system permease protein